MLSVHEDFKELKQEGSLATPCIV